MRPVDDGQRAIVLPFILDRLQPTRASDGMVRYVVLVK